jgi:pyruvyltransferase
VREPSCVPLPPRRRKILFRPWLTARTIQCRRRCHDTDGGIPVASFHGEESALSKESPTLRNIRIVRKLMGNAAARLMRLRRSVEARVQMLVEPDPVVAYWWRTRPNFGDALNVSLIHRLTGKRPLHVEDVGRGYEGVVVAAIGSILQAVDSTNLNVWGSGFLREDGAFRQRPSRIIAVRGPLTRSLIRARGLECPELYGDPALLYPRVFSPPAGKTARLGVVPHYWDKSAPAILQIASQPGVRLIDVQRSPDEVITEICGCEAIASSSLHGIIIALAYGIPAVWIEVSNRVEGAGFKFRDFYASIHAPEPRAVWLTAGADAASLVDAAVAHPIDLDTDRLLDAAPFRLRSGRSAALIA